MKHRSEEVMSWKIYHVDVNALPSYT